MPHATLSDLPGIEAPITPDEIVPERRGSEPTQTLKAGSAWRSAKPAFENLRAA
jgi:hypothetical protein